MTGYTESRSTDSLLSQLTKEPLGVRHALRDSQTEFSLVLWTLGVYECVGASRPICGMPHPHPLPLGHWENSQSTVSLDTIRAH